MYVLILLLNSFTISYLVFVLYSLFKINIDLLLIINIFLSLVSTFVILLYFMENSLLVNITLGIVLTFVSLYVSLFLIINIYGS